MFKFRRSVAAVTAVAAISLATPSAFAASTAPASSEKPTLSSQIGTALDASPSERGVWGSTKSGEDTGVFSWLWYGYTLAATAGLIGSAVALNADNIEQAAAAAGIDLKLPF